MGGRGGNSPDGLKERELRTLFLRAPFQDWAAITQGHKTEFRAKPKGILSRWFDPPTPVVLYAISPTLKTRTEKLMVVTERRSERLLDIKDDADALRREGFATYDEFRGYWRARTRKPFQALDKVEVFRLREWQVNDELVLGAHLLERLYGEYLKPT